MRVAHFLRPVSCVLFTAACVAAAVGHAQPTDPGIATTEPADGKYVDADGRMLVPYTETIPGTKIEFEMIPIPGGDVLMGSPAAEPGRGADEGPQVRVEVPPCWMGKCEVTWAEYHAYMEMYSAFKQLQQLNGEDAATADAKNADAGEDWQLIRSHARDGTKLAAEDKLDGVTSPTPLYDPSFTYSAGDEDDVPAVTMTQFAARQYTKWLSGVTGRQYRLPSEAEWEYAARAGTVTAYSFGDDPAKLGDYGWFADNADGLLHAVGSKKPNPWGLYDMHGNVGEWTLDQYAADHYAKIAAKDSTILAADAILWPTELFPRVIRGGGWLDDAAGCRSAARHKSEEDQWKLSDPNFPHSPWWYTEDPAMGVGLRVIRQLAPMSDEDQRRAWDADVKVIDEDVRMRLTEGRGALGVADEKLPAALDAAKRLRKKP